jgi:hypothetical protein
VIVDRAMWVVGEEEDADLEREKGVYDLISLALSNLDICVSNLRVHSLRDEMILSSIRC